MENTDDNWVNNECGDFMWDDALKVEDEKLATVHANGKKELPLDATIAITLEKIIEL